LPHIVFPRLKQLSVSGYEPYVNETSDSIDHPFLSGVNVLVGINGLGKTTLLNVIFRMLVGPYDPAKGDRERPGRKQAGIVRDNNFSFFRRRANDEAINACASATFLFGTRVLKVTRSLYDLKLIEYALDGHSKIAAVDPVSSDEDLMNIMATLMGFDVDGSTERESNSYRYDYDFVVRNLIFFLEDKIPLIWNPDGQFVILRILLLEDELSENIWRARNNLLRADSQYRNRLWAANRLRQDIAKELDLLPDQTEEAEEFHLLVSEVAALESSHEDLKQQRDYFDKEMGSTENKLLRARAENYEAQTGLRAHEAAYFQQAFRSVRSPGDVILQALASHEGCLVCGSKSETAYERARHLLEHDHCPVCESDIDKPGGVDVADYGQAKLKELEEAENLANQRRQVVQRLEAASVRLSQEYRRTVVDLQSTATKLEQARRRERSQAARASAMQRVDELNRQLTDLDEKVDGLKRELDALVEYHETLVVSSQQFIDQRHSAIIAAFEKYAAAFMVEECRLRFRRDRRARVGQSDTPIDWPAFEVELASGADSLPTERSNWSEVSESQKEFIDLAFRMALLHVASEGQPSMLAVETPEASLDAFFVQKAGDLLRNYASTDPGNVLLVSSNLTREQMIAQLLGTPSGAEDLQTRKRRTLNLLKKARSTRAYRENTEFYDDLYDRAVGEPVPASPATVDTE